MKGKNWLEKCLLWIHHLVFSFPISLAVSMLCEKLGISVVGSFFTTFFIMMCGGTILEITTMGFIEWRYRGEKNYCLEIQMNWFFGGSLIIYRRYFATNFAAVKARNSFKKKRNINRILKAYTNHTVSITGCDDVKVEEKEVTFTSHIQRNPERYYPLPPEVKFGRFNNVFKQLGES